MVLCLQTRHFLSFDAKSQFWFDANASLTSILFCVSTAFCYNTIMQCPVKSQFNVNDHEVKTGEVKHMRKDLKVSHDHFNLIINFVKLCKVASNLPLMTDEVIIQLYIIICSTHCYLKCATMLIPTRLRVFNMQHVWCLTTPPHTHTHISPWSSHIPFLKEERKICAKK